VVSLSDAMTDSPEVVLVGRSSSHFTRTARIFALELGVAHTFRPVYDITALDADVYAGNPALKVPILLDAQGPLYGTENICRELARRSGRDERVILRGDVADRRVANAEELVAHAMSTGVILIMQSVAGEAAVSQPKVRASLENTLAFLDANVDGVLGALPADRVLSFFETALFCVVRHLPFRKLLDTSGYANLQRFCARFGERPGARATEFRFDVPPAAPP
jgi:glutathione S-transferase